MSTSISKSRSPVERSYSSASSTTSSRRSARRKRRRMKHTVMPLKKRADRHEVPCDVHRVSNLDHEEMEQSACFWVAKNADESAERSFKEEVFVNKDQDSSDEDVSYFEETKQSTTDEFSQEGYNSRTDTRTHTKNEHEEGRTDAPYANENENDANYSEEKTFYGVRKGKTSDGDDVQRVSPLSSPRNRSRMSSLSDEGGFSSEGTGMHVGWTSDVGVSSEPEYSGITDEESDGDGGDRGKRGNSREFYGYRKKDGDKQKSEFPTRKIRNNNQPNAVIATDVTTTEVDNFESEERKYRVESKHQENGKYLEIDREFFTKEELDASKYSAYNGGNLATGTNTRSGFDPRVSDPRYYETSEHVTHGTEEPLPGGKTSTPTGDVHPSSDTELVHFRSFDIEIDRQSDRSLPLGGHKTKTQYYSVEDLIRSTNEEASVEKAESGSDGPDVPRGYGEYEKYEPPRDMESREKDPTMQREFHEDPQANGIDKERPRVVPSPYEVKAQRPLLVPRRDKKNLSSRDDPAGTYEDSKEFYGYRRANSGDKYESENKENLSPHYSPHIGSGRPTKDDVREENREGYKSTGMGKESDDQNQQREFPRDDRTRPDDERKFEESKEFYGYRHSKTGAELRDDVDRRQRYEEDKASGDQSKNTKWEETKEFYGYRASKTGNQFGRNESPRYDDDKESGQPPKEKAWEENQEFYGYRQSKTGKESMQNKDNVSPQDAKQQPSGNSTKTRTWEESREFYGYKSKGTGNRSSDKIPKDSRGGHDDQIWEESKEFFGFRRKQVVDGHSHFAVSGRQERPRSPLQRRLDDGKPRYLEPANVEDATSKQSKDESMRDERKPPADEHVTRSNEPENLMSVDDGKDFDDKFEESRDFYGYRRSQEPKYPSRSAAYERYQRPGQETPSEKVTTTGDKSPVDRVTTREYDANASSTRYTERSSRESKVMDYKEQTSVLKESRTDDVYMQPEYTPGDYDPPGKYDPTRDDPARTYVPTKNYHLDSSEIPRDKHMFNILEIPSSKKVIPLVSDVAPKLETTATETTTKRLHTRSQRDTLRREARQPDQTAPESSDMGLKMFRQRSLPRKHGPPTSSDEINKELPRKIKKSDEPDLSQCDPDFANKFREITDKRKKKVKTKSTTKTTETTAKSATESCNQNVEELVNVFNTLEHIQKTADKKSDKKFPPKSETLATPPAKDGKLSPVTSISQKLQEIENILDSVDKNSHRNQQTAPPRQDSHSSEDGGRSRSFERKFDTRKTTETYTTRETRKTREEHETREKHAWRPVTPDDSITKQEAISVESYFPDEPLREKPAGRDKPSEILDRNRPWSYTGGRSPYRSDRWSRGYDKTRSRDDDDEIYRAQIRKSREKTWQNDRSLRKKKYDSKSDGEIEGFSRPFGDRVITPGTPVNIRLYGLNLRKTKHDRAHDVDWELFTTSEVPVDESIGRTQLKKQPLDVGQISGVDIPREKPRMEEPPIDRSHEKPVLDFNFPPSFGEQKDEPQMRDLSMREQHEPLYRRQERLPRKRDAPIARSDSLDDNKVTSQEIKWSHPPLSKVRPEKEPPRKVPRAKSPDTEEVPRAESPDTKEVMEVDSITKTNTETTRKDIRFKSEKSLEDLPSERYPSKKRPSDKQPTGESPSEERPEDIEIPIERDQETETNEEPDERVIEIQYTDYFPEDGDQSTRPEQTTLPENMRPDNVLGSSTPKNKPRSPGLGDDIFDEDTSNMTHEESSSTERHESTRHVDHTIHTTRTTRTTRTETTTETTVKKFRKSGSESSKPETPGTDEPEFIVPVRNEPEYSMPEKSKPGYFTPAEPEYVSPEYSQPNYTEPESNPLASDEGQPDIADGESRSCDEPSLVAHEYIVMNKDTGRPVNLTVLGRIVESDDEDYLSSQSREDLFLHTRLKLVTENKKMRTERPQDVDAHLLEPIPADQDDVDNEGELTDSDEGFEPDSEPVPIFTDGDVTEQLLIPISGKIDENVDKIDKPIYVLPADDTTDIFTPQAQVDEPVYKTDQPTRETITRDSLGQVLIPRIPHEPGFEKENAPVNKIPEFDFEEPISENVQFSERPEKPDAFLGFGEPLGDEEVQPNTAKDIEVVSLPLFESAPSDELIIPPDKTLVNEQVSKQRTATPTFPEFQREIVNENITSEKHDTNLIIPDIPETKPVEPVDETINPSTQGPRDAYIPDLEEALPEMRKQPTPIPVDESITSEERRIEVELPHFAETRPSQPIDEGIILSETIKRQEYIPDFQELFPETDKPVAPVDEDVTSERRENECDIPEFQVAEPERQAPEPITEQISADEPITSDVYIPDFAEMSFEFQEVVPEFPESNIINEDEEIPMDDEAKVEIPGFQEAVQEPVRNVAITESDLEGPLSSSMFNDKTPEKSTPEKDTREKDTPEKDTQEDESWSETCVENRTFKETRTTETVTVEKTITKFVSEVPQKKDEPVSPRNAKTVHFASSIEPKDSGESSPEPSPRSSSGASADVSDRSTDVTPEVLDMDKPEVPARKRRNRRGNRFDNLKRSGPLVPESVVRDEYPASNIRGSYVPRSSGVMFPTDSERLVPEREQPVSNVPDTTFSIFTPREKPGQLRPEMYLLDSDDENQGGDLNKKDETPGVVAEESIVPEEKEDTEEIPEEIPEQSPGEDFPLEEEYPARDELSPELIDELLEKEILGLAEEDESLDASDQEPEIMEEITKEDGKLKVPELEEIPEIPVDEQIDETVLAGVKFPTDDYPRKVTEEIEKSLGEEKPELSDEEEEHLPEEIEPSIEQEQSSTSEKETEEPGEEVTVDERLPTDEDSNLPDIARENADEEPDEAREKSGGEEPADFKVIPVEHLGKDDDVSDKDVEDVMDKDDVMVSNDDNVIKGEESLPGGVTSEEESTIETVIVEKTHSEVSTTVTEITTTRYPSHPSSPKDVPPTTNKIPKSPKESKSDDEEGNIPIDITAEPDEVVKPSEVETVEGIPDAQPTYDESPTTYDDNSIPILIVTKGAHDQSSSDSESDNKSSDSESSTTESDDERTDSSVGQVVSIDSIIDAQNAATETVFGIVDIKYEKPQSDEFFIPEKTEVSFVEIPEISEKSLQPSSDDEYEKDVPMMLVPEDAPTSEDVPASEDIPTHDDTAPREFDIAVVPADASSTTSSDEEPTTEDKHVPRRTSDTTVETIIVEKTSTQISTTITKITASADDSEDSQNDVPVTIIPEGTPTSEDLILEAKPSTPEEEETPLLDINIPVIPADEESTTSSDKGSTSDDEKVPREIPESTVETIIVEKTHSQVSTTITEISAGNAPNYPIGFPNDALVPTAVENVPTTEDSPNLESAPTFEEYPIAEDVPKAEEVPIYEITPISDESDVLVFDISPAVQFEDIDGLVPRSHEVTENQTSERESQTEHCDMYSETTQTEDTTEMDRKTSGITRDAYSMTLTRSLSDSEMQTEIPQGSASTQTDSDSEWYKYTRTVEEVRESSEKVTTMTRQCSDGETQTDIPIDDSGTQTQTHATSESSSMTDDDLRVIQTTHEGTQTEERREGGYFSETEVTRITRKTETRTESTHEEETDSSHSSPPRHDIRSDCPVCLQSLETTNYSFVKVRDLSRFAAMEETSSQYETQESSHSFCFACGRHGTTQEHWESNGYSGTTREEWQQGDSTRERREAGGYSSTARDEWEQEESMKEQRESSEYSSTTREEWRREESTRESSGYSRTTREEWGEDVVIQSESSTEAPGEAHFSIRIDGDEKCSLYCRRSGNHACALEKLASIIEAHRRATSSAHAHSSESAENVESTEDGEHMETGTRDAIGQERCDVGVQTEGALLPADFEVFSDKDFEIYYDEQKSPYWFV